MAGLILPGARANPNARIVRPGATRNPRARIITPGATPNRNARIITPGAVRERTVNLDIGGGRTRAVRQGRSEASLSSERDRGRRSRGRTRVRTRIASNRAIGSGFAPFSRAAGTQARRAGAAQGRRTARPVGPLAGTALAR